MIILDDIKQERWGKVFYVLPGRRTTECAKHAAEVLNEINTLLSRAEAAQKDHAKGVKHPSNK